MYISVGMLRSSNMSFFLVPFVSTSIVPFQSKPKTGSSVLVVFASSLFLLCGLLTYSGIYAEQAKL